MRRLLLSPVFQFYFQVLKSRTTKSDGLLPFASNDYAQGSSLLVINKLTKEAEDLAIFDSALVLQHLNYYLASLFPVQIR